MEPKYSILLCNQSFFDYKNKIPEWLHQGIKVIWFGKDEDVRLLKAEYAAFAKAFLLLAYGGYTLDTSTIVNIILSILSFLLATISIVTVVIALKQNKKMIENATRPYIAVYGQNINSGSPVFYLVIRNFGSSAAFMKRFAITPDIRDCYKSDKGRNFLADMSTGVLAPGQSRICAMDYSKLPNTLLFDIEYSSGLKTYHETFSTNIKAGTAMLQTKSGNSDNSDLHAISYTLQEMLQKHL